MKQSFKIGTRGSKLALWQANHVSWLLSDKNPNIKTELTIIKTTGDAVLNSPLSELGGKGVFVKEIEDALLSEKIDIAVHSMKDVPTIQPEGLTIAAVIERHDPSDALVSKDGLKLSELPHGSRVGTGSLRRASQLLNCYPGLEIVPIRGNVDTRVRKLKDGEDYDAIILAVAGLERMGLKEEITEVIPSKLMLPAPGQGIIALECREQDSDTVSLLKTINDKETEFQANAERAFLMKLGGDCNIPAACLATLSGDNVKLEGVISSPDGKKIIRMHQSGTPDKSHKLGEELADSILKSGGFEILDQISNS